MLAWAVICPATRPIFCHAFGEFAATLFCVVQNIVVRIVVVQILCTYTTRLTRMLETSH